MSSEATQATLTALDRAPTFSRAALVLGALLLLYLALVGRLVQLQFVQSQPLSDANQKQMAGAIRWSPWRGSILDARGRTLAISVKTYSCAVDPKVMLEGGAGVDSTLEVLANALDLSPAAEQRIREQIERPLRDQQGQPRVDAEGRPLQRRFVWVKRLLNDDEYQDLRERIQAENQESAEKIQAGDTSARPILGVLFPREYARRYPQGRLAAHLLGFGNIDGKGMEGCEKVAGPFLCGLADTRRIRRDARNRTLASDGAAAASDRMGLNVEISVDATIQLIVEQELAKAVEKYTPAAACAVVMDPYTGDVLSLANYPSFDPNQPAESPPGNRLNQAIVSIMEPGSTFKPFIFARALEKGLITLTTPFNCEQGAWRMACGRVLHDAHGYGVLPAEMVLVKSSNIGIAKIAALLGTRETYRTVRDFGFGKPTGVTMPGEVKGIVHPLNRWTAYSMGSVPMGQEISVTPLQLATAFSVIANGGSLVRPRIVRRVMGQDGALVKAFPVTIVKRNVIRPKTAAVLRKVLRIVVTSGTGKRLRMAMFPLGGKTGTAQLSVNREEYLAGQRGYSEDRYVANMVGLAPAEVPRIVVLVSVREPHGAYYGGVVAGPVVREISRRALLYLGEPPQNGAQTALR